MIASWNGWEKKTKLACSSSVCGFPVGDKDPKLPWPIGEFVCVCAMHCIDSPN